jgi:hypothetical protein
MSRASDSALQLFGLQVGSLLTTLKLSLHGAQGLIGTSSFLNSNDRHAKPAQKNDRGRMSEGGGGGQTRSDNSQAKKNMQPQKTINAGSNCFCRHVLRGILVQDPKYKPYSGLLLQTFVVRSPSPGHLQVSLIQDCCCRLML